MTRPFPRAYRRLAAVLAAAVAILVGTATAASAHADLVGNTPAQSAHFPATAPPRSVVLTFDDVVTAKPGSVAVYDGAGRPVTGVRAAFSEARTVRAQLPRLADGTYVVVWHIVSDDGHPETGAFTFGVGAAGASTVDIGGLLASRSSGRGIGAGFGAVRALVFLGCLVLIGGLAFLRWRWPGALGRRDVRSLLLGAAALGIVGSLVSIPLQAAYSSGGGARKIFDDGALSDVLGARFGRAALARAGLLAVLAVLVVVPPPRRRAWVRGAAEVLVSLALLATFAYSGHGATGQWPALGFLLDVAHLGAAALWLGGLVVLAWALRGRRPAPGTDQAAARFSRLALPAVAVVVLSGTVQAWRQIAGWSALWHTSYARLLVIKVLIVVAIVVLASAARTILRGSGSGGRRVSVLPDGTALRELRSGVWLEAVLAVAVLAVTATLVVTPPAREAAAAARRPSPQTTHLDARGVLVGFAVTVQPMLAGDNTIVVRPRLLGTSGFLPVALTGAVQPADGPAGRPVQFAPLADGRWVAVARLGQRGTWTVRLRGTAPSSTDQATLQLAIR